ncbi:hypothetical protein D3C83_203070 [compost metagenome]
MKGDLPGLSNFCCGYIGSYQYSTFRSGEAEGAGVPNLLGRSSPEAEGVVECRERK